MKRCDACRANEGMVPDPPLGEIVWCDHGALADAVAAAELRDRIIAARHARATRPGQDNPQ